MPKGKVLLAAGVALLLAGVWMAADRALRDRREENARRAAAERAARVQQAQDLAREMDAERNELIRIENEYAPRLKDIWKRYDAEPEAKKTKARLNIAADETTALVKSAPEAIRAKMADVALVSFRKRMAPLIRPEARASGEDLRTLIPSTNAAQCLIWGSMWARDSADDLTSVGFTKIACPDEGREWPL